MEARKSHHTARCSQVFADKMYSFGVEHYTAPNPTNTQLQGISDKLKIITCVFDLFFVPKGTSSDKLKRGDANKTEIPSTLRRTYTFWVIFFVWGSLWNTCKGKVTRVARKKRRQHQPAFAKSQIWLSSSTSKYISISELPLTVQPSLW